MNKQKSVNVSKAPTGKRWYENIAYIAKRNTEIAKRLEAGESVRSLASEYNLSTQQIYNVKKSGKELPR